LAQACFPAAEGVPWSTRKHQTHCYVTDVPHDWSKAPDATSQSFVAAFNVVMATEKNMHLFLLLKYDSMET